MFTLALVCFSFFFFFSSRRRHTRFDCDWSSDVCSSDLSSVRATLAMTRYLNLHKGVYGYYLWLGVTDAGGRIVAATDPASVGRNQSKRGWFRAVRERGGIDVEDAEPSVYGGVAFPVDFSAPIKGSRGVVLGT